MIHQPEPYTVTATEKNGVVYSYQMPTRLQAMRSARKYEGLQVIVTGPRGGRWKLCRDERFTRPKYNWRKLRPQ
jgi:protein gp37